jgi:hypothetical protein
MENERKIKMLQVFYAGVLADSVLRYGEEGILEKVTLEKKQEQLLTGKARANQLGIEKPEQVFEFLADLFGCANWKVKQNEQGFEATATNCMLCALSKKLGAKCPCSIYCLDAMEGMVKGLDDGSDYNVVSTLWNDHECKVIVKTEK